MAMCIGAQYVAPFRTHQRLHVASQALMGMSVSEETLLVAVLQRNPRNDLRCYTKPFLDEKLAVRVPRWSPPERLYFKISTHKKNKSAEASSKGTTPHPAPRAPSELGIQILIS